MTCHRTHRAHHLASLALMLGACRHPDPRPAPPAAAAQAQAAPRDEGELRAAGVAAHAIGAPGPALTVQTIDGSTIDLGKLYGDKPVYLKFWATWCIPCREQMPGFERIYETLGDRMTVIAVNAGLNDDADAVRAFRGKYGLRMPIVVDDGRLAAALDLQVTPQHVLIGKDARIAYVGHLDGEALDAAIQNALAEPAPRGPVTGQAVTVRPTLGPGDLVQLEARTLDGAVVTLGPSPRRRPRAVVLFSASCESYLATSLPETSRACRRVREQADQLIAAGDVDWLGIVEGLWASPESVAAYRTKTATKLPLALDADGSLFRAFGVHWTPAVALVDRDGRLVRVVGPDERDLAAAVRALAASN